MATTPLDQLIQLNMGGGGTPAVQPPLAPPGQAVPQSPPPGNPEPSLLNDPRFLLDFGARALQPRSPAQGQFGFAAQALQEALTAMDQRKAAKQKGQLEERKVGAVEKEVGIKEKTQETAAAAQSYIDELRKGQTEESLARAAKLRAEAETERKTGGGGKVAAAVQQTQALATNFMKLYPDLYKGEQGAAQAYVDAETFKERVKTNPAQEKAKMISAYLTNPNTLITDPKDQQAAINLMLNMTDEIARSAQPPGAQPQTPKPAAQAEEARAALAERGITNTPERAGLAAAEQAAEQTVVEPTGVTPGSYGLPAGVQTDVGKARQLAIFRQYPQAIRNYAYGKHKDNPVAAEALIKQIQDLVAKLPAR